MTALEFVAVVLAGVLYGWLWAEPSAKLLAPLKWAANRALTRRGPVWDWLRHRLHCPVCMGFDASLAATWHFTREASWGLLVWPFAAAGAHLVWQYALGVAVDMADALTALADSKVE